MSLAKNSEPIFHGTDHLLKRKWLVNLYVRNDDVKEAGKENGLSHTLRSKKACYLSQMFPDITRSLNEMMDEAEKLFGYYTDAGYKVIRLS